MHLNAFMFMSLAWPNGTDLIVVIFQKSAFPFSRGMTYVCS